MLKAFVAFLEVYAVGNAFIENICPNINFVLSNRFETKINVCLLRKIKNILEIPINCVMAGNVGDIYFLFSILRIME